MEGQRFMRERVLALGPDLAAAYFLLGRGCRVRFKHQKGMFQSKYLSCSPDPTFNLESTTYPAFLRNFYPIRLSERKNNKKSTTCKVCYN